LMLLLHGAKQIIDSTVNSMGKYGKT
jgi:hypothetical protein